MAISKPFYEHLVELSERGIFAPGGSLLEIGQANWYGEWYPDNLNGHADTFKAAMDRHDLFGAVRSVYDATIAPVRIESIDLNGGKTALRLDLNEAHGFCQPFDTVINHGTAEHVFKAAQVFQTMHESCAQDGIMIHEAPWTGWVDHGFYSLQPTLFYDLAHANNYRIELMAAYGIYSGKRFRFNRREQVSEANARGELAGNLNLFVVLRKIWDKVFEVPTQGIYSGVASQAVQEAWCKQR